MEISIHLNKYVYLVYVKYIHIKPYLVDGFNPFEKYARQIGSSSQVGGKNKKCSKPPPRYIKKPYNNLCIVLVHSLLLGVLGPALQLHPPSRHRHSFPGTTRLILTSAIHLGSFEKKWQLVGFTFEGKVATWITGPGNVNKLPEWITG